MYLALSSTYPVMPFHTHINTIKNGKTAKKNYWTPKVRYTNP